MVVVVAVVMVAYDVLRPAHGAVAAVTGTSLGGRAFRVALCVALRRCSSCSRCYAMVDFPPGTWSRGGRTLQAWRNLVADEALYQAIVISLLLAVFTVVLMLLLLVPTMIWVRLRHRGRRAGRVPLPAAADHPRAGDRRRSAQRYAWVTYFLGESALTLTFVYVVLVLPFAYRAIDAALSAIDVRRSPRRPAAWARAGRRRSLRVVVPNIWSGVLSAAFISVALVLGEFTIASLLGYETLQVRSTCSARATPRRRSPRRWPRWCSASCCCSSCRW